MTDKTKATRLADALTSVVQTYPQMSEDEPGGYCSEVDQIMDEAAALLRRWPDGEPCVWVDEVSLAWLAKRLEDHATITTTLAKQRALNRAVPLYAAPPDQSERIAALEAERSALRTALEFASAAVEDAIYTEDGIDGQDGERLLYIFREALERGTFDKVRYGDLPPMLLEVRNNALEAALEQARVALENVDMAPLVRDALRAIEEVRK